MEREDEALDWAYKISEFNKNVQKNGQAKGTEKVGERRKEEKKKNMLVEGKNKCCKKEDVVS